MKLLDPLALGARTASNRVLFGPHVTNLGDDERRFSARHVAYYARRARGGCGTIVVEGASVHDSDWPYERAPLAARAADGWAAIVAACQPHGALVIASLDHAGSQGSSAYSQRPLWAPSRTPDVVTREVPKWMEADDIAAVVQGFADAAAAAVGAGCDGVEINAGQHSLVRQFLSGLTNHRGDEWGADRARFARDVIAATRTVLGAGRALGLRLSCDELAPWAGITPDMATALVAELVEGGVDYVVVMRGSIFSAEQTRPDHHQPTGINVGLAEAIHGALDIPVLLQGSVVDVAQAEWALGGYDDPARCDGVEMTRAQIADPDVVAKVRAGQADRIRPCTRCNQTCQVRDARNPLVTCIGEPSSGHETEDPDWYARTQAPQRVVVLGGGPAGLETARVAARRGHDVTIVEPHALGGMAAVAGPNGPLVDWLTAEVRRLGVTVVATGADAPAAGATLVQCTGSRPGAREYAVDPSVDVVDVADVHRGVVDLPAVGAVVVFDPIGGPIGVALAEQLGDRAVLVTQDQIAGNELARTGDLAPANVRLAQAGVSIERRSVLRAVGPAPDGGIIVTLEDRFSAVTRTIEAAALVDCGFRLPDDPIEGATVRAGDCVAPRTVHEAILEARRAALAI